MIENKHGVQKKMWKKWTDDARSLFNEIFELGFNQPLFMHPEASPIPAEHWKTIRWNFAFAAADELSAAERAARNAARNARGAYRKTVAHLLPRAA